MPDQFDAAQKLEELQREHALRLRKPTLPATGLCHNCQEHVAPGLHFCDTDCSDDFQAIQRAYELRKRLDC